MRERRVSKKRDSLLLHCGALSSPPPRRFIPALSDSTAITSLRLLALLNVLSQYASLVKWGSSSGARLLLTGLSGTSPRHAGRVEDRRGCSGLLGRRGPVSRPRSSKRTCGFPASGSRAGLLPQAVAGGRPRCIRRRPATPQLAKHQLAAELPGAARGHLLPPPQKSSHSLTHVVVHRPAGHQPGPMRKVTRLAHPHPVQPVWQLPPAPHFSRTQQLAHLLPQPCHALARRRSPQIPMAILA